jgi:phosphotransferase system HPr (HPr) family protein
LLTSSDRAMAVPSSDDLHARPAAQFCKTALQFKSRITVLANGKSADPKSLLSLLALGAKRGTPLRVRAEGEDAEAALDALAACLDSFK